MEPELLPETTIPETGDDREDAILIAYALALWLLWQRGAAGQVRYNQLVDETERIANNNDMIMYALYGADLTIARAVKFLREQYKVNRQAAIKVATDIISGRYQGEAITSLAKRLSLWVNKANRIATVGKIEAPAPAGLPERRFTWELGATEQHCRDCLRLNGATLTASEWRRLDIYPQSPDLECGGWLCDCRLRETENESVGIDGF